MKGRVLALSLASLAAVVAMRFALNDPGPIPLIVVPQGVSAHDVSGVGRVFVVRDGEVFYAFSAGTRGGKEVVWCARAQNAEAGGVVGENVFWSRDGLDVYDRYGGVARGGTAGAMIQIRTRRDARGLHIARARPTQTAPKGEVASEILQFYERWLNRANLPSIRPPVWCPNPIG